MGSHQTLFQHERWVLTNRMIQYTGFRDLPCFHFWSRGSSMLWRVMVTCSFFPPFLATRKKYWPKGAELLDTVSTHGLCMTRTTHGLECFTAICIFVVATQITSFGVRKIVGRGSGVLVSGPLVSAVMTPLGTVFRWELMFSLPSCPPKMQSSVLSPGCTLLRKIELPQDFTGKLICF